MPGRTPNETAAGGEAQLRSPEQRDDSQTHEITGLRERSSRRPEQPDSSSAINQTARPGASFELKEVLPDSVYRWACGESDGGDERTPIFASRLEVLSTWVILIAQAICYVRLWILSGSRPPEGSQRPEGSNNNSFIFGCAGVMYLLLSVAAADLLGGSALASERPGSRTPTWFWWRKALGLGLLGTFVTLIGASVRALLYSSHESLGLVIGAAVLLLILDADPKDGPQWRFYVALEIIVGFCFVAVLAINVAGVGLDLTSSVAAKTDIASRACNFVGHRACDFFSWDFFLNAQDVFSTVGALAVTGLVSANAFSFGRFDPLLRAQPGPLRAMLYFSSLLLFLALVFPLLTFYEQSGEGATYHTVELVLAAFAIFAILAATCLDRQDLQTYYEQARAACQTWPSERRRRALWGMVVVLVVPFRAVSGRLITGMGIFFLCSPPHFLSWSLMYGLFAGSARPAGL